MPHDHPNDAPGVPMVFPPWFERLQIKYVNPLMAPFAKRLPSFAIVKHRGRTSGTEYETIVEAFRKGNLLAIGLLHGKTNWAKNVLAAGGADICLAGKDLHVTNPRILLVGTGGAELPKAMQLVNRRAGVFVADIG